VWSSGFTLGLRRPTLDDALSVAFLQIVPAGLGKSGLMADRPTIQTRASHFEARLFDAAHLGVRGGAGSHSTHFLRIETTRVI
jgi:hypothetical protein